MQLTGLDSTIPAPWGSVQVRVGCSAPEDAPCEAVIGFLGEWSKAKTYKLAEGTGVQAITLANKNLRIVLPAGWELGQYPVTVEFDQASS